jgi:hypothetical protein
MERRKAKDERRKATTNNKGQSYTPICKTITATTTGDDNSSYVRGAFSKNQLMTVHHSDLKEFAHHTRQRTM